jgi:hypothetical protein
MFKEHIKEFKIRLWKRYFYIMEHYFLLLLLTLMLILLFIGLFFIYKKIKIQSLPHFPEHQSFDTHYHTEQIPIDVALNHTIVPSNNGSTLLITHQGVQYSLKVTPKRFVLGLNGQFLLDNPFKIQVFSPSSHTAYVFISDGTLDIKLFKYPIDSSITYDFTPLEHYFMQLLQEVLQTMQPVQNKQKSTTPPQSPLVPEEENIITSTPAEQPPIPPKETETAVVVLEQESNMHVEHEIVEADEIIEEEKPKRDNSEFFNRPRRKPKRYEWTFYKD